MVTDTRAYRFAPRAARPFAGRTADRGPRKFVRTANVVPGGAADDVAMTRIPRSSKVVLVADRRLGAGPYRDTPIRRYRLARLRFDERPDSGDARFDHLKRVYD